MTVAGRRWSALAAAYADLERLKEDDERLAIRAIALLDLIADGKLRGEPLQNLASYGDLTDCLKFYFGVGTQPTHRIVYRQLEGRGIEVVEAVAVEQRDDGYVYLLAAERLGRLPSDTKKRLNRVHQAVIARRGLRRRKQNR